MKPSIEKYRDPAGHRKRLRDRFLRSGREGFPDYELLELLLTYSLPRVNTKPIAKALLHKFGTIVNIFQQPNERLEEIQGIGPNTMIFSRVFQDCLTRCMEVQVENQRSISSPEDLFAFIRMHLGSRTVECIYALYHHETAEASRYGWYEGIRRIAKSVNHKLSRLPGRTPKTEEAVIAEIDAHLNQVPLTLEFVLRTYPGKELLKKVRGEIQRRYNVSLSNEDIFSMADKRTSKDFFEILNGF